MHPNDNKWATPVSVGDFFLFLECLKDQRLTAKTNTGICQLNPETKYFLSSNEMEGLLSPQI